VPIEGVVAGRLALASSDQVRLDGPLAELPPVSVAVVES
jgi:hypothetical protein